MAHDSFGYGASAGSALPAPVLSPARWTGLLRYGRDDRASWPRPDLADWIGDPAAGDIGNGTVHRLEQRRKSPFRIDIAGWGNADSACTARAKVGQDVAEEIGRDDDIEPVQIKDEMCTEDVDVVLVPADIGEFRSQRFDPCVSIWHGDGNTVGLGGRCQVLTLPLLGKFERIAHYPIYADAGHDSFLQGEFPLGASEHDAAAPMDEHCRGWQRNLSGGTG